MPFDGQQLTDVQKVLLKAAEEVRKGWCQSALEDKAGNVCLAGAVNRAIMGIARPRDLPYWTDYPDDPRRDARERVFRAIGYDPVDWNDEDGRTAEEVAAALEAAAFMETDDG